MTIALANSWSQGVSGASHALTLGFTATVGNKLLLAISHYDTSQITKLETDGVVWTPIQTRSTGALGATGTMTEQWLGDVVGPSVGTNLDITVSGGVADRAVAVHEVSGLRDIWPVDKLASLDASASPADTGLASLGEGLDSYMFGALGGADSSATTDPGAPSNGFTLREEVVGPNANQSIGHRVTTFDKIVSAKELARSQLSYSGFTRWAGMVASLRGDTEAQKPIERVPGTQLNGSVTTLVNPFTLPVSPTSGNTLLMAAGVSQGRAIQSISQPGVAWVRDMVSVNGSERTEIWRGTVSNGAATSGSIIMDSFGSTSGGFIIEEHTGSLSFDQVASSTGSGSVVGTGVTAAIESSDQLVFGVMNLAASGFDYQEAQGYLRAGQNAHAAGVLAVFINNESFLGEAYEVQSNTHTSGVWASAVVTYKSNVPDVVPGPSMAYYGDEHNQSGTTDTVSSTSYASFASVGPSQFVSGNRHLIIACARVSGPGAGRIGLKLDISGQESDEGIYRPGITNQTWTVCRVAALDEADTVSVQAKRIDGPNSTLLEVNLVVIDLDSVNFFEGRDWSHIESTTAIQDMDATFGNNVGASMRFRPDGDSDYLVIAHARMTDTVNTLVSAENVMRLRDLTNAATLAQAGWHSSVAGGVLTHSINAMAVLESPAESDLDFGIEMIGGGPGLPGNEAWGHLDSSLTVIRLGQFFSAGFNQATPGNTPDDIMPPSVGHVDPQAFFPYTPDEDGEIITLAYAESDNVASDISGIATQAQFVGASRSLWDTENVTLGNVVDVIETVTGNYDTNDSDTRIPTFGVSRRTGFPSIPDTAKMFNGALTGAASLLNRAVMVCFGKKTATIPSQTPAPTPVTPPAVVNTLQEKADGVHEAEALDNLIEQFKPGVT